MRTRKIKSIKSEMKQNQQQGHSQSRNQRKAVSNKKKCSNTTHKKVKLNWLIKDLQNPRIEKFNYFIEKTSKENDSSSNRKYANKYTSKYICISDYKSNRNVIINNNNYISDKQSDYNSEYSSNVNICQRKKLAG